MRALPLPPRDSLKERAGVPSPPPPSRQPPARPLSFRLTSWRAPNPTPPSVYADGGICLDILQNQWSPIYDVSAILTSIQVGRA